VSGEAVLALEDFGVTYPTAAGVQEVVRQVTLDVRRGECLGVVGESAAGKSQLFLAALGLTGAGARLSGSARFEGMELRDAPARLLNRVRGARIGMVFQNPLSSLTPHLRIEAQIAEVLTTHRGLSRRAARRHAAELLERVHLPDAARRARQYPHELSGGMRQRAMIAIALACEPQLLIADEPTTALDVTIQAQILALLAELKRERALTIILISHDMGVVAGLADRIAVMHRGQLLEVGEVGAVLRAPQAAYTRDLLAAQPRLSGPAPAAATAPATATAAASQPTLLEVRAVGVDFRLRERRATRTFTALDAVSFALEPGEALGIVGESGSGKSTLARAILQLIRPLRGEVVWLGSPLQCLAPSGLRALRRDLQLVFQDPLASLDPLMTAAQIVEEPLALHRGELSAQDRRASALAMLARVGLAAGAAERFAHELSGGQCQRVAIARAMILKPRLLICDEPVSALDASLQAEIVRLIDELRRASGTAVLFVSHNLAVVRELCQRVLVLYRGRMMELAPAATLYDTPLHPYSRALLDAVPLADPALQPARLKALRDAEPAGAEADAGSAGCVFRARCPHAIERCAHETPPWSAVDAERFVACLRWPQLALRSGSATDHTP